MANKKRDVYKPKPMTEGKKAVIQGFLLEGVFIPPNISESKMCLTTF
jgi:hypothetical protein